MSLLAQSCIEQMRKPDACFLQLLPDDRGVHRDIGRVDLHFARWMLAGRTMSSAVLRSRLFGDGEGFVCPVHRRRMGPALNFGWRDRFHQLGGGTQRPRHHFGAPARKASTSPGLWKIIRTAPWRFDF